jgi:hypothetical protein
MNPRKRNVPLPHLFCRFVRTLADLTVVALMKHLFYRASIVDRSLLHIFMTTS